MKRIRLLFVGEVKAPWAIQACAAYTRAVSRYVRCEVLVVKDAKAQDPRKRTALEGQAILKGLGPRDMATGLDQHGEAPGSEGLAALVGRLLEDPGRTPCFVVGGPYGYSPEVSDRFDRRLSLGPYTLPHDLARIILLEQLYRALTILAGHPYHHG